MLRFYLYQKQNFKEKARILKMSTIWKLTSNVFFHMLREREQ